MIKDDNQYVKIDSGMKNNFFEICKHVGINESTSINKFISRSIEMGSFDIDITNYDKISTVKTDTRLIFRIAKDRKLKFKELCEENGISASAAIKLFMHDVITTKSMERYFN